VTNTKNKTMTSLKGLLACATLLLCAALPSYAGTLSGPLTTANGQPTKNAIITFTPTQMFYLAGTGAVVPSSVTCATSTDGTIVGLLNPQVAGTLTRNLGIGTLPAGTYYVVFTVFNASGERLHPPSRQLS
jgi:hypothetical protein